MNRSYDSPWGWLSTFALIGTGIATLGLLGLNQGCSDREGHRVCDCGLDGGYAPQVSPDSVLKNLDRAFEAKNFEEYRKLFDQELYRFELGPEDRCPGLPPTVGWPEEREAIEGLLSADNVFDIRQDLTVDPTEAAASSDSLPFASLQSIYKLHTRRALLEIDIREENGGPLTLLADGDEEIYMKEYTSEHDREGRNIWRIVYWRDRGSPTPNAVQPISWSYFRKPSCLR